MSKTNLDDYRRLIQKMDRCLNEASRVKIVSSQREKNAIAAINKQAAIRISQISDAKQSSQDCYRGVANLLQSPQYSMIGVRMPSMIRPISVSDKFVAPNQLEAKQKQIIVQINKMIRAYIAQAKAEIDAAAQRQAQAQALLAARARSASLQKAEPAKRIPWGAIVVGCVTTIVVIAFVVWIIFFANY